MKPQTSETSHAAHSSRFSIYRMSVAAAIGTACLALGSVGCGDGAPGAVPSSRSARPTSSEPSSPDEVQTGSLSLALDVGAAKLMSVTYTIIGGQFVKSGSIDVSNSTRVSGVVGGIPFGNDYALTLSSSTAGPPQTDCAGSATFAINAPGPTLVPVNVTCRQTIVAVTPPPPATPAPIPQLPVLVLALGLLGLGVAQTTQRRSQLRE